ncbi:MAG TPA: NlpC/P60 family protein [Rhizomicrobium sp.]|nr:NlpC/P60 family protein [Rhizomicrobium sp.]
MADKRVTPARSDLAAAHLKGVVDAPRYAAGEKFSIRAGRASLRLRPSDDAAQDSELLFGEIFTVYDSAQGWAWGQAADDLYVGYLRQDALAEPFKTEARVSALMAPVFSAADLKTPVRDLLPLNAAVPVLARAGDYVNVGAGFVHRRHLAVETQKDFVAVSERFLGASYVWGGKTVAGLDCSGLIQTALQAVGKAAPRDTDMMEKALGDAVALSDVRRGDLIFWKGHMGVMLDETRLLHANAFHMAVAIEPLAEAMARIEKIAGPVTSIKRL